MSEGSWTTMLRARARQNRAARMEREPGERVAVWVTQTRRLVPPLSWIVPFRRERLTRLDPIGSRVWSLCDGQRTVEEVVDAIAIAGRPDDVRDQLRQWDGLADHVLLYPPSVGVKAGRSQEILSAIIETFGT